MSVDRNFMEFWGNFLLMAAKGQKQMEDLSKMTKGGFWVFPDMDDVVKSFSGMETMTKASTEYLKMFVKANEQVQKSLKDFLSLMDLVPRKDYLELLEENEALKKNIEEQAKDKMEKMLDEEVSLQAQGLRSFEELMRNQTRQFQDLMSNFTRLISQSQSPAQPEAPKEPEVKKAVPTKKKASPGFPEPKK